MKGFKDSTKVQYMKGGSCDAYAKGGSVKGAAKIAKVMGEFKRGDLHSGSKEGPKVTNPKQAKAIAMSEARKAGMKAPMKKGGGGDVKMPSAAESAKSGNRVAEMEAREERFMSRRAPGVGSKTEREMREMKKRVPATSREPLLPAAGESVKSGNRVSAQEAAEMRAMGLKKGGPAKKAFGGAVMGRPDAMPVGGSGRGMVVRPGPMGGGIPARALATMPARALAMMPRLARKAGGLAVMPKKGK